MIGPLLALLLVSGIDSQGQEARRPSIVAEGNVRYSFKDDILELPGGHGWLRTQRVYLDFRMEFEYRAASADTDASIPLRIWMGGGEWPDTGYKIHLPADSVSDVSAIFVGYKKDVRVLRRGRVDLKPAGEWQHVEIAAEGRQITLTLNGTLVGVFETDRVGGHILFENRKGRVEFRNVHIAATDRPADVPADALPFARLKSRGNTPPRLTREVKPHYTPEAMRRLLQGVVTMQVVVMPDGSVGEARVTKSLDPDLDRSAVAAVREWRFKPGLLNGEPVAVQVDVDMSFTLK